MYCTAKTKQIVEFWEILHDLTVDDKRRFLEFISGSDRGPVGGLGNVTLIIYASPHMGNKCLPVSHTCMNMIELPKYVNKDQMKEKLLLALNYTKGFGLA